MKGAPHTEKEIRRLADICFVNFDGDVFQRCRERRFVDARITFSMLINEQGIIPTRIGRILDRNHATILHYMKRGEALLETNRAFRKKYVACREEYIGEDPIFYYSTKELRHKFLEMQSDCRSLREKHDALQERVRSSRRLEPIIDMVRMRTKPGTEDEVLSKLNRIYNGT
jgi:hypothetical protein